MSILCLVLVTLLTINFMFREVIFSSVSYILIFIVKSMCGYPLIEQLSFFIAHFLQVFFSSVFQFYSVPLVLELVVGNKSMLQFNASVEGVIYLSSERRGTLL